LKSCVFKQSHEAKVHFVGRRATKAVSQKVALLLRPYHDSAIRARVAGEERRTRAIVIYPMNALANSQLKELEKFIDQSELPERLRPTFARYAGQESQEEREHMGLAAKWLAQRTVYQFSSASRCTAAQAGFLLLSQSRDRPDR
jgi:hypothetical protein